MVVSLKHFTETMRISRVYVVERLIYTRIKMRAVSLRTFICFVKEIVPVGFKYRNISAQGNARYIGCNVSSANV